MKTTIILFFLLSLTPLSEASCVRIRSQMYLNIANQIEKNTKIGKFWKNRLKNMDKSNLTKKAILQAIKVYRLQKSVQEYRKKRHPTPNHLKEKLYFFRQTYRSLIKKLCFLK